MIHVRMFTRGVLAVVLACLLTGQLTAMDQQTEPNEAPEAQRAERAILLQRTSKLIGEQVRNTEGEQIGSIYDLVLTSDYQQVDYVALSHGGVWGIGDKLFTIPWNAIRIGPAGNVIVPISRAVFAEASGFDEGNWPAHGTSLQNLRMRQETERDQMQEQEMDEQQTGAELAEQRTHRPAQMPERQEPADEPLIAEERGREMAEGQVEAAELAVDIRRRRVTNLTGMPVRNEEGEDIGNLEGFVVDMREGRLTYTIVSFGGFWGIGENYAAVPSTAVEIQSRRNFARLDANREALEQVAFEPGEFPNLADRSYARRLHETFDTEPYWVTYGYVRPEERRAATERAWGPQGEYVQLFEADALQTIEGTVQSIGTFRPAGAVPQIASGLRLRVKTEQGDLVTVYAGPRRYAQQQNFYVRPGDEITVTGTPAKAGWRSVFIPSQLTSGDRTLNLFNEAGEPQWRWQQQGSQQRMRPWMQRPSPGPQR